jgi:glucokinase
MEELFVGIDLGGTNIKAGLVTESGAIVQRQRVPTEAESGPDAVARRLCEAARRCAEESGTDLGQVRGIGVGSPGTHDPENGVVLFSPNLPGWRDVPLRRLVQDEIGLPVVLDNDANVAALAEQWIGAGRGCSSLVLLTLGTGIGSGIVLDGRIWHGADGVAGEVGHMSIDPHGLPCGCGNRGCLEVYASATGMVRRMREAIDTGEPSVLAERRDALTARLIHEAAVGGDAAARHAVEETGRYLGVGVSNLLHLLNPQVVAFSGGVAAAGEMLMAPVRKEVAWRTLEASRRNVRICFSEVPEDAGILGAARAFMIAR